MARERERARHAAVAFISWKQWQHAHKYDFPSLLCAVQPRRGWKNKIVKISHCSCGWREFSGEPCAHYVHTERCRMLKMVVPQSANRRRGETTARGRTYYFLFRVLFIVRNDTTVDTELHLIFVACILTRPAAVPSLLSFRFADQMIFHFIY